MALSRQDVEDILENTQVEKEGFKELDDVLGFSPRDSFDFSERTDLGVSESEYAISETRGTTKAKGREIGLYYDENLTLPELAHESVHGNMLQPNGKPDSFPSDNVLNQRLYGEFVARLAEGMVGDLETGNEELHMLYRSKQRYQIKREEYAGEELDEELDSLYDDFQDIREMEKEKHEDIRPRFEEYRKTRETVLAKDAAEQYLKENDVDLNKYLNPSFELYEECIEFIKESEKTVLKRIK